jgi:hypothetical protein
LNEAAVKVQRMLRAEEDFAESIRERRLFPEVQWLLQDLSMPSRHGRAETIPVIRSQLFEGFLPEDLDGADGLRAGLAGDLLVDFEMDAILTNLLGRDQIGGLADKLAELSDTGVVGLFGALTHGQELEVIGEGI